MTGGPEISVLIATHNRSALLRRCLESLREQDAEPGSFEVVVAADGCEDGTERLLEQIEVPYALSTLELEKGGKATALNAALEVATGSACLFIDDDVIASRRLVADHAVAHRDGRQVLAIGKLMQRPPDRRDWYAHAFAAAWNERYEELGARRAYWSDCYGGNFSAPRETLLRVGGFDAKLPTAEDTEIGYRLFKAGCEPRFLPNAEAVHDDQKGFARMLADQQRYGAACPAIVAAAPEMRRRLLNWFNQPTPRDVCLRRLMLALRVPPRALVAAGRLIPGRGRKEVWFGFVSRYAFWAAVRGAMSRREWRCTTRGPAVLMYHGFGDGERDRFVIDRRRFAWQMRVLALLRYRVISFGELVRRLRSGEPIDHRTAVITIDDGYRDNLEVAQPILRRRGFPATIFLVTGLLDRSNEWDREGAVAGRPLLSPDEVRRMREEGIEFGAHTRTHCSVPDVAEGELEDEVHGSRADLEQLLGEPVNTFAFPYGRYDERGVDAVADAGFTGACTVDSGFAYPDTDPLQVPRIEIEGEDGVWRFLRKLAFAAR